MSDIAADAAADAVLPARIGPYRIVDLLGEGTTGRVYLAEESDPPRQIALKVLRAITLPAEARNRFRREAELLARLEHPAIARLYAAGVADTDAGPLPYLAMERVQGQDLLRYAREHMLDLHGKLALLAEIGRAVHYAHSRGIVHRDLKPANILVDAEGRPHILDFGLAHMVRDDATAVTLNGQVFGSVPYMSAEQLAGSRSADDPRSDVYALGVIAYELLSGQLPYPGLSTSTLLEAIGIIREGRIEPLSRLAPTTRGDVETVVMKAMASEAAQRYGSAAELAEEFDRVQRRQPIAARPPTAAYLLSLFVRRHRALSVLLALLALTLIGATAVSLRYAAEAAKARDEAASRATESEAVNRFLEDMLTASSPDQEMGRELRVREILDHARLSLGAERNPVVAASLYRTLGSTYTALAQTDLALELLTEARKRATDLYGADSPQLRAVRLALGEALIQKADFAAAETELQAVAAATPHTEDEWRQNLGARRFLAISLMEQHRFAEGQPQFAALADEASKRFGTDDVLTMTIAGDSAQALQAIGEPAKAVDAQRALLADEQRALGPQHPQTLNTQAGLATSLAYTGNFAEAIPLARSALDTQRQVLGDSHPDTLFALRAVSGMLRDNGQLEESLQFGKAFLDACRKRFGPDHRQTLAALNVVGATLTDLHRDAEAEPLFREGLAAAERHPDTLARGALPLRNNYASLLVDEGRLPQAAAEYQKLTADSTAILGAQHWETAHYRSAYGDCLFRQGRYAQARSELEAARAIFIDKLGPEHRRTRLAEARLRKVYLALGLKAEAAALPAAPDAQPGTK